ncbi:MAG TPA: efflux RND transporter periplasmic adaptor subunit [Arenimonas sp.]|uniref:efflux RND transporter periplasmic adaptor subunit n=1 Tax=Arenimonas sp. TaxID=1872635 RepID=UPI002D7E5DB6|nr:efflux RND transporter periplasmic adaptor subunit [Arenimonas sp.]HEU0152906.1 efflux RND transporter periplasmic adaptor subunit [Arenimonas sp.]
MTRSRLPALLLLSTLLLAACADDAPPAEPAPSLTVSVAAPLQQTLPQRVVASGSIAAWEPMALGVELSGQRVAEVRVEVGDVVAKDQPLLQLDTRSLQMELRQAEAVLAQAEASLAVASANARRGETLRRERLISDSEADQLASGELTAKAQRQTAQAQLDNARLRLGFATLRAPAAGVISQRLVQPGRVVSAGTELLTLIRDGRLEWRAELPERDLIRITPGVAVELQGPDGAAVAGTVRAVSPALDAQSRTGVVYADLPAPGALRAGMYAQGALVLGDLPARTVPDQAIVERDGYRYVFVLGEGDVVAQRRVALGVREGGVVQVLEGLAGDEQVVVEGAGFLADGDRVRVVAATGG